MTTKATVVRAAWFMAAKAAGAAVSDGANQEAESLGWKPRGLQPSGPPLLTQLDHPGFLP